MSNHPMSKEALLIAVATATPAKCRRIQAIINDAEEAPNNVRREDLRLTTISGAAKLLAVGRSTVYALLKQKRLESVILTGVPRVKMQSIYDFLAGKNPENEITASMIEESKARYAKNKAKGVR